MSLIHNIVPIRGLRREMLSIPALRCEVNPKSWTVYNQVNIIG